MSRSKYPADWEKRRRTVFERDGWECKLCGHEPPDETGEGLHAHHKRPISKGGGHSLDNLVTICPDCHTEIHSNDGVDQVPAPQLFNCAYDECDNVYRKWESSKGSYCSDQCYWREKATRLKNRVDDDPRICSTCFSYDHKPRDYCEVCGNWDLQEDNKLDVDPGKIDIMNLLTYAMRVRDMDSNQP